MFHLDPIILPHITLLINPPVLPANMEAVEIQIIRIVSIHLITDRRRPGWWHQQSQIMMQMIIIMTMMMEMKSQVHTGYLVVLALNQKLKTRNVTEVKVQYFLDIGIVEILTHVPELTLPLNLFQTQNWHVNVKRDYG